MNTKTLIVPTLTEKTLTYFKVRLDKISKHFDRAQFDLVDETFADNKTFDDIKFVDHSKVGINYDLHIMSREPKPYIQEALKSNRIDTIIFHFEIDSSVERKIKLIKESGKRVGIAINPKTKVADVEHLLDDIDLILVMCVNPGFYGSPFIPDSIYKILKIRDLNKSIEIMADGGISDQNIFDLKKAGANVFCVGSFLSDGNMGEQKEKLEKALDLIGNK